jgi:hydroxypyruvate isomerase
MNRKQALQSMAVGAAGALGLPSVSKAFSLLPEELKGTINHSACRWCYQSIPLEELLAAGKAMGLKSIELLGANDWPLAIKHGLTCAMGYATDVGLNRGFNDPKLHKKLLTDYSNVIPKAAELGITNLICFSGNANGLSRKKGIRNCAKGLEPVLKVAQQYKVTITMELLNSKVDHKDYQCDTTDWGVELCEKLGYENFKLLYDIYHMQIMEGDVIATIKKNIKYISHFHTGGVPGRHEIDETQELYYPIIMKAIADTGFKGYVAQEFIPTREDKLGSLKQGVTICDI